MKKQKNKQQNKSQLKDYFMGSLDFVSLIGNLAAIYITWFDGRVELQAIAVVLSLTIVQIFGRRFVRVVN